MQIILTSLGYSVQKCPTAGTIVIKGGEGGGQMLATRNVVHGTAGVGGGAVVGVV